MKRRTVLMTGIVGSIVAAICCFTPILLILMGAVGLAAFAVYLDYVLIPSLLIFLGITVYALVRMKKSKGGDYECKL